MIRCQKGEQRDVHWCNEGIDENERAHKTDYHARAEPTAGLLGEFHDQFDFDGSLAGKFSGTDGNTSMSACVSE